jgi:hypothetical protein
MHYARPTQLSLIGFVILIFEEQRKLLSSAHYAILPNVLSNHSS